MIKYIIIGGGAAGLFAAIRSKMQNPSAQVILLEKTNQLLSKVRISGGGRCNVTHACFEPGELIKNYPRGSKELLGPFHTFQPKDTIHWFQQQGVSLKTENDGRMFPSTDSSQTIIDCLMEKARISGVEIRKQQHISDIEKIEDKFVIHLSVESLVANRLLLATGSAPWGHLIAAKLGHTIVRPVPSLFTFSIPDSPLLDLAGISVPNATATLAESKLQQQGALLLTHWGFSGPAILKLSAWAARELEKLQYKTVVHINWTSSKSQETLYQSFLRMKKQTPKETLPPLLPAKLLSRLLEPLNIDPKTPLADLSHRALAALAQKLHADPYLIQGKATHKQEFVTAGGVDLKEIDFKTMESKVSPGLFFAGEILNIDGITGGFNFQSAWTTGWIAGTAMKAID